MSVAQPNTTSMCEFAMRSNLIACLSLALFCCQVDAPAQRDGLDALYAYVDSDDMSKLVTSNFSKTKVPSYVLLDQQERVGSLSVAGRSSVDDLKKSFNLLLKSPYQGRHEFRINAMSRDQSALRAMLAFWVFEQMGSLTPERRYISFLVNHEPYGVFILHEKIDEEFFSSRGMKARRLYSAIAELATMESNAEVSSSFDARLDTRDFSELERIVTLIHREPTVKNLAELEAILNVDSVLTYMAVSLFINNSDGINNNFFFARAEPSLEYFMIPWDVDLTFRSVTSPGDASLFSRNGMMRRFFENPVYRQKFNEKLLQILELEPELYRYLDTLVAEIEVAHANDRVLSESALSLREHAERIRRTLRSQFDSVRAELQGTRTTTAEAVAHPQCSPLQWRDCGT